MAAERTLQPDARTLAAIGELIELVQERYPSAAFVVEPSEEDPAVTHIVATVDVEDPDEVVDLVIDRMLELQIEEGIPVHLIPVRTAERVAELRRRQHEGFRASPALFRL